MDVYLYKLHGSLNWKKHKKYGIEATSEERRFTDLSYEEDLIDIHNSFTKSGRGNRTRQYTKNLGNTWKLQMYT
jgi:hypothetical protein